MKNIENQIADAVRARATTEPEGAPDDVLPVSRVKDLWEGVVQHAYDQLTERATEKAHVAAVASLGEHWEAALSSVGGSEEKLWALTRLYLARRGSSVRGWRRFVEKNAGLAGGEVNRQFQEAWETGGLKNVLGA